MGLGTEASSLVEVLRHRARATPDRKAYAFLQNGDTERETLTYRELDAAAVEVARRLRSLGGRGERAFLLYPPGLEFLRAFFGCLYAGVVAVPLPVVRRSLPRLQAVARDARASLLLTDARTRPQLDDGSRLPEFEAMRWLVTDEKHGEDASPASSRPERLDVVERADGSTLAYLQYTSGSTSTPKGVVVTHGSLVRHCARIEEAWGYTGDGASATWVPHFHDYGLVDGLLLPLWAGIPAYAMSPAAFYMRPTRWIQAIARHRVSHTQGPDSGYEHCLRKLRNLRNLQGEELEGLDLRSWRTASDGGEPVRPDTVRGFVAALEPYGFRREAFYPAYGLAEATLLVATKRHGQAPVVRTLDAAALEAHRAVVVPRGAGVAVREVVSCGPPIGDLRVVIADPRTRARRPDGAVGEIWVSGPGLADGYWDNPAETERTFSARLSDTGDGPFLRTGDLGFLMDGELSVTGRMKDVIIVRGRNHYPQDVERTVERSHPALRPGHGAAFAVLEQGEERLVVVQEVERGHLRGVAAADVAADVREAVAEEHELRVHAVVLTRPGSVPRTSSGKVRRAACRALFLEGALEAVGESGDGEAGTSPRPEAEA